MDNHFVVQTVSTLLHSALRLVHEAWFTQLQQLLTKVLKQVQEREDFPWITSKSSNGIAETVSFTQS